MESHPLSSTRYVDVGGLLHVADHGGSGAPIVLVHGLGGSHVNWMTVAPGLGRLGHVTAPDLPGFGLSPAPPGGVSFHHLRKSLDRYLRTLGEPVTLIGNSMGGTLAMVQAALAPETVSRLVLVSPAAPFLPEEKPDPLVAAWFAAYLAPGLGRLLVSGRRTFVDPATVSRLVLELCAARPSRLTPDILARHFEIAEQRQHLPGIDVAFLGAVRTLLAFVGRRRAFESMVAAVACPTLVIHGDMDRLVPVAAARRLGRLRPDWQVEILGEVGHIAMLEVPATFTELVEGWMRSAQAA
jgi:pimeloyl-ACP methyl ester carboxylesterase